MLHSMYSAIELFIPLQFGKVLDAAVDRDFSAVIRIILAAAMLFLAMIVLQYLKTLLYVSISNDTSKNMKNYIVSRTLNLSAENIEEYKNGELFSRFEDVDKVMSFLLEVLNSLIMNFIILVFLTGMLLKISIPLALLHFFSVPFLIAISCRYSNTAKQLESELIQERDKHYSFLFGAIQGIREMKSLGMVKNVEKVFQSNHENFMRREVSQGKLSAFWEAGYSFLAVLFQMAALLVSCWQIMSKQLTVGMYYSFNSYASSFSDIVQEFIGMQTQFAIVMVSVDKIMDFLQEDLQREPVIQDRTQFDIRSIEAKNLTFRHKGMEEDALKQVNFRFKYPSFRVIAGHNGSGKSTLLNVIMDYYSPDEGNILVNGMKVIELRRKNIYKKIVYIRQTPFFFNMSIMENFKLVDENLSIDEVVRVCQMTGIHEYIMSLPEQYNTEMGETGEHFSGGQIQCLAIARGLILDADVYLLDEVISDLDGDNEQRIMKLLRSLNKIVILVTHRLSKLEPTDKVLLLEHGEVVAQGRHRDLLKTCYIYQKLSGMEELSSLP